MSLVGRQAGWVVDRCTCNYRGRINTLGCISRLMRADSRRRSVERVKAYRSGRFIQCTDDRSAVETSISFRGRLSHRYAHSYLAVPLVLPPFIRNSIGDRAWLSLLQRPSRPSPSDPAGGPKPCQPVCPLSLDFRFTRQQRHPSLRARKPCYTPPCGDEL